MRCAHSNRSNNNNIHIIKCDRVIRLFAVYSNLFVGNFTVYGESSLTCDVWFWSLNSIYSADDWYELNWYDDLAKGYNWKSTHKLNNVNLYWYVDSRQSAHMITNTLEYIPALQLLVFVFEFAYCVIRIRYDRLSSIKTTVASSVFHVFNTESDQRWNHRSFC